MTCSSRVGSQWGSDRPYGTHRAYVFTLGNIGIMKSGEKRIC